MADTYRTGNTPLTGRVSYLVNMPAALWFAAEVADALNDMCDSDGWTQSGTVTIDDAVQAAEIMVATFGPQIGAIYPYITSTVPDNCLACDGTTYNRVDYPNLYASLDSTFIVDADTFRTPDLRGRTLIGTGTGSGLTARSVGDSGGEETHALTSAEMPSHSHTDLGHSHIESAAAPNATTIGPGVPEPTAIPSISSTASGSANLTSTGGDGAHNNMQPFLALNYCVVAR